MAFVSPSRSSSKPSTSSRLSDDGSTGRNGMTHWEHSRETSTAAMHRSYVLYVLLLLLPLLFIPLSLLLFFIFDESFVFNPPPMRIFPRHITDASLTTVDEVDPTTVFVNPHTFETCSKRALMSASRADLVSVAFASDVVSFSSGVAATKIGTIFTRTFSPPNLSFALFTTPCASTRFFGHFIGSFASNGVVFLVPSSTKIGIKHTMSIALNSFLFTSSMSFIASLAARLCKSPFSVRAMVASLFPVFFFTFFVGVCISSMNKSSAVFFARIDRSHCVTRNRSPTDLFDSEEDAFVHGTQHAPPPPSSSPASFPSSFCAVVAGGNHDTAAISVSSRHSSFASFTSFTSSTTKKDFSRDDDDDADAFKRRLLLLLFRRVVVVVVVVVVFPSRGGSTTTSSFASKICLLLLLLLVLHPAITIVFILALDSHRFTAARTFSRASSSSNNASSSSSSSSSSFWSLVSFPATPPKPRVLQVVVTSDTRRSIFDDDSRTISSLSLSRRKKRAQNQRRRRRRSHKSNTTTTTKSSFFLRRRRRRRRLLCCVRTQKRIQSIFCDDIFKNLHEKKIWNWL